VILTEADRHLLDNDETARTIGEALLDVGRQRLAEIVAEVPA
jgi:hypothetical protein